MTIRDTDALVLGISISLLKAQIKELNLEIERLKHEREEAISRAKIAEEKLRKYETP
jgi:hypothetical protein